jgi:hypothetical protein
MTDPATPNTPPKDAASPVEAEIDYEVWQSDAFGDGVAMVAGSTSLEEAQHYCAVYGQDWPVWIVEVTRRRISDPNRPDIAPAPTVTVSAEDFVLVPRAELEDFSYVISNLIGELSDPGSGAMAAQYRIRAMLSATPAAVKGGEG